jgi:acyl-homoserine-lactone acylase
VTGAVGRDQSLQAQRYAIGKLRDVYFYPQQLESHIERSYHPGE